MVPSVSSKTSDRTLNEIKMLFFFFFAHLQALNGISQYQQTNFAVCSNYLTKILIHQSFRIKYQRLMPKSYHCSSMELFHDFLKFPVWCVIHFSSNQEFFFFFFNLTDDIMLLEKGLFF